MLAARPPGLLCALLLGLIVCGGAHAGDYTRPKVRAITAFVRLDRATYAREVSEALAVLRAAKGEFEKHGYEVQSLRIVTQPLGELVSGQSETQALVFLKAFDDL